MHYYRRRFTSSYLQVERLCYTNGAPEGSPTLPTRSFSTLLRRTGRRCLGLHSYVRLISRERALIQGRQDLDDLDVVPPLTIQDHGQVLREIMVVYESSISEDETPEQQASGVKQIIDSMVDPAIEMCLATSEEKHRLRQKWDHRVFVLNCLTYIKVSWSRSCRKRGFDHLDRA